MKKAELYERNYPKHTLTAAWFAGYMECAGEREGLRARLELKDKEKSKPVEAKIVRAFDEGGHQLVKAEFTIKEAVVAGLGGYL